MFIVLIVWIKYLWLTLCETTQLCSWHLTPSFSSKQLRKIRRRILLKRWTVTENRISRLVCLLTLSTTSCILWVDILHLLLDYFHVCASKCIRVESWCLIHALLWNRPVFKRSLPCCGWRLYAKFHRLGIVKDRRIWNSFSLLIASSRPHSSLTFVDMLKLTLQEARCLAIQVR